MLITTGIKRQNPVFELTFFALPSGKCKADYGYHGTPAPDDNRPVLKFDTNAVIELLDDSDSHWFEVSTSLGQKIDSRC